MIKVIKRDGAVSSFTPVKITEAIMKAQESVGASNLSEALSVTEDISRRLKAAGKESVTVSELHHLVEFILLSVNKEASLSYTKYRKGRDKARELDGDLHKKIMGFLDRTDKELLDENMNKDSRVLHTQRDLLAGIVCKHYGLNHVLPEEVSDAHERGEIYWHDMDYSPFFPITNCCTVDLKFMFESGFKMGAAEISTPKSITTAVALISQVAGAVSSSQYGGTTFGDLDLVLAPYVKASFDKHLECGLYYGVLDEMAYARAKTEKEVDDAMQGLLYEVNTLHTSNGQAPFLTFGFGTGTSWEAKLVQKAILRNQMKGLGERGLTPVFPKLVYAITEGHNAKEGDPFYDVKKLAVECSSKRFYPDFLSVKNNMKVTGADKVQYGMGCRSYLGAWQNDDGEYVTNGRNNLGVVSLNLPRIAIESNGNFKKFWDILDSRLALCKVALDFRISTLDNTPASVAPILYTEGALGVKLKPTDMIGELFKNGRSSISLGYIGVHEVLCQMFGSDVHPFDNEEAKAFSVHLIQYMKNTVDSWKKESGFGYSLYSTPAESLCHKFCVGDTKQFGEIKGVTDKGYYTNSFHLDVFHKVSPFEKFDYESPYSFIATGGHICYSEYPNMKHNLKGLEDCLDYGLSRVPYIGVNTPTDQCFSCGFEGEFTADSRGYACPKCNNRDGDSISVVRRTCGYLGSCGNIPPIEGKQKEIIGRVKHVDNSVVGKI